MNFFYRCNECCREYEIIPERLFCDDCHDHSQKDLPPWGILEVMWQKAPEWNSDLDLLPVPAEFFPALPIGNTPLWQSQRINDKYGFRNLFIKDDTVNLTGSLKDRASLLVAAFARQHKIKNIMVASTGNAGSSMAGVGAACGMNISIYVPSTAPAGKLLQARQYGAEINLVDGNYDEAYQMVMEKAAERKDVLNRNTAANPLTIEGKKTAALELFRQLNSIPDIIFIPVGDGVILGAMYKGFEDLRRLGRIENIPQMIAVQAEGSSALSDAFHTGGFVPISANTIADSISVNIPQNGYYALAKLKQYEGNCVTVSDNDILKAQLELSRLSGLFAEPAAAASLAGLIKMKDEIDRDKKIIIMVTGIGLKDLGAAQAALDQNGLGK